MSQILIPPEDLDGERFLIKGTEAHHVLKVLRKKEGDQLDFFDGRGTQFHGVLTRVNFTDLIIEGRISKNRPINLKETRIRLFQGLPRGSKFDYVLEKATELGADEITPFLSEKSLIRLSTPQSLAKLSRWSRVVASAAKQCDRSTVPVVTPAVDLMDLASELRTGLSLIFLKGEGVQSLRSAMSEDIASVVNLVIGPESGFSNTEMKWLLGQGAVAVSLGQLTLRTETAGLVALALVNYQMSLA